MEAVQTEKTETKEYQGVVAPLDFEIFRDILINMLNANQRITVATAGAGGVTARSVDYANADLKVGFFSWEYTHKIADIEAGGSSVALCLGNLSITGTATVQHNLARGNADLMIQYKSRMPELYKRFMKLPNACFVAVKPTLVTLTRQESGALYLDTLDVAQGKAYRVKLSDWK